MQRLFACDGERQPGVPVGVAVHLRTGTDLMRILHLAVHAAYEHGGAHAALDLTVALVNEARSGGLARPPCLPGVGWRR